ncbi:unnamed protein product [Alopecurus aequalis]
MRPTGTLRPPTGYGRPAGEQHRSPSDPLQYSHRAGSPPSAAALEPPRSIPDAASLPPSYGRQPRRRRCLGFPPLLPPPLNYTGLLSKGKEPEAAAAIQPPRIDRPTQGQMEAEGRRGSGRGRSSVC